MTTRSRHKYLAREGEEKRIKQRWTRVHALDPSPISGAARRVYLIQPGALPTSAARPTPFHAIPCYAVLRPPTAEAGPPRQI